MMVVIRVILLLPFSVIFAIIAEIRRPLYKHFFKTVRLNSIVVSVGNLTSGGTGKTPFVMKMLEELLNKGISVSVVSRSYKAEAKTPQRVNPKQGGPEQFGDEAFLIASKYPAVSVFVGPNKLETAIFSESQVKSDVILIDDGFQHLRLQRDFDIVLIDVTEPRWHYLPLPSGFARDALWQLDRADYIILTKENLAKSSQKEFARAMVTSHKNIIGMDYLPGPEVRSQIEKKNVLLVSAIGRPLTFESLIRSLGATVMGHIIYSDHHPYSQKDIDRIWNEKERQQADCVVTTEKDFVKLRAFSEDGFVVATLEPRVKGISAVVDRITQLKGAKKS